MLTEYLSDWFNPKTQEYWNKEFDLFYNAKTGVDIDGVWIDMNEPANVWCFQLRHLPRYSTRYYSFAVSLVMIPSNKQKNKTSLLPVPIHHQTLTLQFSDIPMRKRDVD